MSIASKEEMKILFRQPSMGWCSVYLLANIFRDKDFLRFTENEDFKGCGDEQVDYMLTSLKTGLKISPVLKVTQAYGYLPIDYVLDNILLYPDIPGEDINTEIPITPYLLTVSLVPGIFHHVGILNYLGRLFYIDPYLEYIKEVKVAKDLEYCFIGCIAVDRFETETKQYAILLGEKCGYDFLLNETLQLAND